MRLRRYTAPMATTALCTAATTRHAVVAFAPAAARRAAARSSSSRHPSSSSLSRRITPSSSSSSSSASSSSSSHTIRSLFSGPTTPLASSPHPPSSFQSWASSLFSSAPTEEEIDPGAVDGTDLRVLKYPHPSLRASNDEVPAEELTGPGSEISKLAKEMFLVMYATQGVGLAAPQVGVNKRLMVYNESGDPKKWMQEVVMVNPQIVEFSEATDVEEEGCLSFPGMGGDVERSKWIKVEAYNLKGKKMKKKYKGWEARIFQHEYDHLDGKVYIDRLTEEGQEEVRPRLDELIEEFGEGGEL